MPKFTVITKKVYVKLSLDEIEALITYSEIGRTMQNTFQYRWEQLLEDALQKLKKAKEK